jgi:hypothetical protein
MPANDGKLTLDQMIVLWREHVIGLIEFRTWLAQYDSAYDRVRDKELDDALRAEAEERRTEDEQQRELLLQRLSNKPVVS